MLSDSYTGYGVGSLTQDADEMHILVELLRDEFDEQVRRLDRKAPESAPLNYGVLSLAARSELHNK